MMFRTLSCGAVFCLVSALPAAAQSVTLQFQNGHVSLHAENASLRQVLAEWSRLGGTKIVNGERLVGAPVTMELQNVPEQQALAVLLRGASGYMIGARTDAGGASAFDRIMILPTSTPPRNTAAAASPGFTPQAQAVPQPMPEVDDLDEDPPIEIIEQENGPGRGLPPRARFPRGVGPQGQVGPLGGPGPLGQAGPNGLPQNGQAEPDDDQSPQPPAAGPANPFGLRPGSSRPGEISPVPRPPQTPRPDPEP